MRRKSLPFRRNCEGYFINEEGKILAGIHEHNYLVFPGGGFDNGESPKNALIRETFEETGAMISKRLQYLGCLHFTWSKDWPRTKKQKERYKQYQGEEMHFFFGSVKEIKKLKKIEEDFWHGKKFMTIEEALNFLLKNSIPKDLENYRRLQINILTILRKQLAKNIKISKIKIDKEKVL